MISLRLQLEFKNESDADYWGWGLDYWYGLKFRIIIQLIFDIGIDDYILAVQWGLKWGKGSD